jgi:Tol biopolymer transport system component
MLPVSPPVRGNMTLPRLTALLAAPVLVLSALLLALMPLAGRWFPSGGELLYISQPRPDGNATLYVTDLRGGVTHGLLDFLGWGSDAAWSPDGRRIAFSAFQDSAVQRHLYILDVSSGQIRQITTGDGDHNSPAWSPDGRYLVFQAFAEGRALPVSLNQRSSSWDLFRYDLQTGQTQLLYTSAAHNGTPAWSPDGRSIAFISISNVVPGTDDIYLLDLQSGAVRNLTDGLGAAMTPAWSPDGRLAFAANDGGSYNLFTIEADGDGLQRLTDDPVNDYKPAWSPDGRRIAFATSRPSAGDLNIYVIDADGYGVPRRVSPGREGYRQPHWRP